MEDTIYKTFRAELKGVEDEGTLNMLIPVSTDSVDRDGEVIEPTAFRKTIPKFMKHPVLVASHDYRDLTNQIGEWTKVKVSEDGILGKPKYYINAGNEQADWAYYLASKGVAAFSVGFIPKDWEDGDDDGKSPKRTYKEVELLEISQVIIPSNREAIQSIRSKSADPVVIELCDEVDRELEEDKSGDGEIIKEPDVITKPEETDEYIRIPISEGHDGHRIRTITISADEGIKALYCGTCKEVKTYLFAKDKGWTMAKAKKWVKDHEKSIILAVIGAIKETPEHPQEKEISQQEILDEIDYLKHMIKESGMNEDVETSLQALTDLIGEEAKAGAVLNKTNKNRLNQIKVLAQEVLDSAGEGDEEKRLPVDDTTVEKKDIENEEGKKKPQEPTPQEILDQIQKTKIGGK